MPEISLGRSSGGREATRVEGPVTAKHGIEQKQSTLNTRGKNCKRSVGLERKGRADVEGRGLRIKSERYLGASPT